MKNIHDYLMCKANMQRDGRVCRDYSGLRLLSYSWVNYKDFLLLHIISIVFIYTIQPIKYILNTLHSDGIYQYQVPVWQGRGSLGGGTRRSSARSAAVPLHLYSLSHFLNIFSETVRFYFTSVLIFVFSSNIVILEEVHYTWRRISVKLISLSHFL